MPSLPRINLCAALCCATLAVTAHASLITYHDLTSFNAVAPAAAVQTFAGGLGTAAIKNPLTTASAGTLSGSILSGITFSEVSSAGNPGGFDLSILDPNGLGSGNSNRAIFSNNFQTLRISFANAQSAVALGLLSF